MYDLFSLGTGDIAAMADRAVMEAMAVAREAMCRAEAVQVRSIARLARIRGHTRWVADEIALELCLGRQAAADLVDVCLSLTTRLPAVLAAMDHGEVSLATARKICDVTAPLSDELCRRVDEKIAGRIVGKDAEQARRIARDAVHTLDPDGCAERAEKRREDRKVELVHTDDGMASLWAYLSFLARQINPHLVKWAMRKHKHLHRSPAKARRQLARIASIYPGTFAHWRHGALPTGSTVGAV